MKPTTRPPVTLTCCDSGAAETAHRRLAHNALAWSMLHSKHAQIIRAYSGIPNVRASGDTSGGPEYQLIQKLIARIEEAEARHGLTLPGTAARLLADAALDRMEALLASFQSQLKAMSSGPGIPAGHRDQYTVTVPALHARVAGVEYVADQWQGVVTVDDRTARLDEYLGRGKWVGCQAHGNWPLYGVRGDKTGLKRMSDAEEWHAELLAALWPAPGLPELAVSMTIEAP